MGKSVLGSVLGSVLASVLALLFVSLSWAPSSHAQTKTGPSPTTTSSPDATVSKVDVDAIRNELSTIRKMTEDIAESQRKESSFLRKIGDDFVSNTLWEIFGFKKTEKTIVGCFLSLMGIIGLSLKLILRLWKPDKPEPRLLRSAMLVYLVLAVTAFSALTFSSGIASEYENPRSAARTIVEATGRFETSVQERLRVLDERLSVMAPSAAATRDVGEVNLVASKLSKIEGLAESASRHSQEAARIAAESSAKAGEAAGRSTGWAWHFLIVGLLVAVLIRQSSS
jgi:hypothetical protein